MNRIKRVAIIGECMVELRKNNGTLSQSFGGDTLNTAVYLARLTQHKSINISYITALGQDPFSKEMLNSWQEEYLNTDMVFISKDKLPGIYTIETNENGERNFYYWRNDTAAKYWLRECHVAELAKALCQHQMIYLSGISIAILPLDCRNILFELLQICRKKGVIIAFDNNYRPELWQSQKQAQQAYHQILALTDIAFLTFNDEQALYGDSNEYQAIMRAQMSGIQEIVIKRGGDACFVASGTELEAIKPKLITNIVDTTAAGDSFSAGYLAKRILGGNKQQAAIAGHTLAGTVIQHYGALIANDEMPSI